MITLRLWVVFVLLAVPAFGSAQGGPAADMGAINSALAELVKAYQERNAPAIAALMANEVQAFGSTFNATGLEEWRTKAAPALAPVRGARVAGRQDVTMSGNLAYVAFVTDVQRESSTGVVTEQARWTVVFQKSNNRWLVVHYHLSPNPR
jgi:ketosteroid isomerase-like protein